MIRPLALLFVLFFAAPGVQAFDLALQQAIETSAKELAEVSAKLPADYQKAGKLLPEAVVAALRAKQEQGIAFAAKLKADPTPADDEAAQSRAEVLADLLDAARELASQTEVIAGFAEQFPLAKGTPFGDRYLAFHTQQLVEHEKTVLQIAETGVHPEAGPPGDQVKGQILLNAVNLVQFQKDLPQQLPLLGADQPLVVDFTAFAGKALELSANNLVLVDGLPADTDGLDQLASRHNYLDEAFSAWRQALQNENQSREHSADFAALGDSPMLKEAIAAAHAHQEAVRTFSGLCLSFRPDNEQERKALERSEQTLHEADQRQEATADMLEAALGLAEIAKQVDERSKEFDELVVHQPLLKQTQLPDHRDQLLHDLVAALAAAKQGLGKGDKLAAMDARHGLEVRVLQFDQFLDLARSTADDVALDARVKPHLAKLDIQALNKRLQAERAALDNFREKHNQAQVASLFNRQQIEQLEARQHLNEELEATSQESMERARDKVAAASDTLRESLDVIEPEVSPAAPKVEPPPF